MKKSKKKRHIKIHTKMPRFVVLMIFIGIIFCIWFLDKDDSHFRIIDHSIYIKYLSYNIGNDFTIFSSTIVDDDPENHNYFVTTAIPKVYTNNGIQISVNKDGSISVQGFNAGNILQITLNEEAQIFPAGQYYFSAGSDLTNNMPFSIEWSKSDEENNYSVCAVIGENQDGYIECNGTSKYKCVLTIPKNCDLSDGITLFPVMRQVSELEVANKQQESENNISYLRSIYPYGSQPFGKVFQIKSQDFYSMSDFEKCVFRRNLKYLYFPKYQYVSILFEDGTGIQFSDSDLNNTKFGTMDSAGILVGESASANIWSEG